VGVAAVHATEVLIPITTFWHAVLAYVEAYL
jgi:hypothetical protein